MLQGLANYMYVFHGKAAHASAAPWDGRNALNAVQLMFHAVDMLRQHTTQDAQFHGIVRNGGEAPNIVRRKPPVNSTSGRWSGTIWSIW